mgnify:CR=1 FL=1
MEQHGDDVLVLSSGKRIYANRGILGIRDGDNTIYDGYDGEVWSGGDQCLTHAERAEIADYMIALWQRYRILG